MTERQMNESSLPTPPSRARPLPGKGRLGVVSAIFLLTGACATVATLGITVAILRPSLGWTTVPENHFVAFTGAVSLTYGCFRTSWLLDRRRREGVVAAALFVAAPLVGGVIGSPPSVLTIVSAVGGVALLASLWRPLRATPFWSSRPRPNER